MTTIKPQISFASVMALGYNSRSSAYADKPARRVYRSVKDSRSSDIVPFHILGIVSYCAIVTLSLRNVYFYDIRLQKCRDLENWVRGPSKSLEMSPCNRPHTISYWRSIVTMALSLVVSEIFNVEKCRDLEIWMRGHSRSLKVLLFDRLCMISY